jgi:hypothetical protein
MKNLAGEDALSLKHWPPVVCRGKGAIQHSAFAYVNLRYSFAQFTSPEIAHPEERQTAR